MLIFQLLYNGVYCQNIDNISRKIWTSGVEYGKICIGEQPGFYTMAVGRFCSCEKEGCHMMIYWIL